MLFRSMYPKPASGFQGKFSLVYSLTTALLDGRLDLDSFTNDKLARPEYAVTSRKIRINVTSKWGGASEMGERRVKIDDRLPVIVRLKDGRTLSESTARVSGLDTDEAVFGKFRRNASRVLPPKGVDAALVAWRSFDTVDDVRKAIVTVTTK
mgnify:CR=1 FL=1